MKTAPMRREFSFQGLKLPDPNPQMSVEDVRGVLCFAVPGDRYGGDHRAKMKVNRIALAVAIALGYLGTAMGYFPTSAVPTWLRKFFGAN